MSATEREALEAGSVWIDGDLFSGKPDLARLASIPYAPEGALRRRSRHFSTDRSRRSAGWSTTGPSSAPASCLRRSGTSSTRALLRPDPAGRARRPGLFDPRGEHGLRQAGVTLARPLGGGPHPQLGRPGRAAPRLRHAGAAGPLPPAPRPRRGDPLLRPDRAGGWLRRRVDPFPGRRLPGRRRPAHAAARLGEALHHPGAGRHPPGPGRPAGGPGGDPGPRAGAGDHRRPGADRRAGRRDRPLPRPHGRAVPQRPDPRPGRCTAGGPDPRRRRSTPARAGAC